MKTTALAMVMMTAMAFGGTAIASASNINVWKAPYAANIRYCPASCTAFTQLYNYSWVTMYSYCDLSYSSYGNYWSNRWFHITWPVNGWVHSSLVDHQIGVKYQC